MGSSRFPGKMLVELGPYPILEWVLRRSRGARLLDEVVLATTHLAVDYPLVEVAQRCGVRVFRGSETDVLGRFADAADWACADQIVRICADNPFIDPAEIDRLVEYFLTHDCDYACNEQDRLGSGYADGFGAEILSALLLKKIAADAIEASHREHVTLFLWDHAERYNLRAVTAPAELAMPGLCFDVNTRQDLAYLRTLISEGVSTETPAKDIIKIALASSSLNEQVSHRADFS
jgi:spore coat polysaccharide biosynthesis protein SpsF